MIEKIKEVNSQIQELQIDYARWIVYNCRLLESAIVLEETDRIYYTNSGTDMKELYSIYLQTLNT